MDTELDKAKRSAARLLSFRPRSEKELVSRLAMKKISRETIEQVVQQCRKEGFLDDARFARLFAVSLAQSRGLGKGLIRLRLNEKGLAAAHVEEAMKALEEFDETETASRLAATRLRSMSSLENAAKRRRLHGFLARRGFSSAVIFRVLQDLLGSGGYEE